MKSLWKKVCVLVFFAMLLTKIMYAQCEGSMQSISYDTIVPGSGNAAFQISLPKFNPSIGTLLSTKINSAVSLNYGFTLKNVELVQRNFSVAVGRYDQFASAALITPYSNLIDTSIGIFVLNPGDSVTEPSHTILYRYNLSDSITDNIANFLGDSSVSFNYTPITYTNLTGSNVYYYSATANDTVRFSITYFYCSPSILANNILSFSATRENSELIKLNWLNSADQETINYEIEAGNDGTQFYPIAEISGEVDKNEYNYYYPIKQNQTGEFYFRIKVTYNSGTVKYSEIKAVNLGSASSPSIPSIYPNPAHDFINVSLQSGDWETSIFSSSGQLIQSNSFGNTSNVFIKFKQQLSMGMYFIEIKDVKSSKRYLLDFLAK